MNVNFHQQLAYYSNSNNNKELAERVCSNSGLKKTEEGIELTQTVSDVIEDLIKENLKEITSSDIQHLEKLHGLVRVLNGEHSKLGKTIAFSIASASLNIHKLKLPDNIERIRSILPLEARYYLMAALIKRDQIAIESLSLSKEELEEMAIAVPMLKKEIDIVILRQTAFSLCKNHSISFTELDSFLSKYNYQLDGIFEGETPLTESVHNNNLEMVKLLKALGADVNKCNKNGYSPLFVAAENSHLNMVVLLKSWGAEVDKCNNRGKSPLLAAVMNDDLEMVRLLVQLGADVNKSDNKGSYPLSWATITDNMELMKLLKDLGADVNKCDKQGNSLLCVAISKNDLEMVNFLKRLGVDINKCNNDGISPLFIAARDNNLEMVKLLKSLGADVDKCNGKGDSPLLIAASKNNLEMVKLLKDLGADVGKCNGEGDSPLLTAACNNHLEMVKLLKDLGADVNKCNHKGNSPLFIAAINNDLEMVKLLKSLGADVDKCNDKGNSPLLIAVCNRHLEMVKLLKDLGADVNKSNKDGDFPLLMAIEQRNMDMAALLESLGGNRKCAEEISKVIMLCHIWGIGGTSISSSNLKEAPHAFSVEGTQRHWTTLVLSDYVDKLFKSMDFSDENGSPLISQEDQNAIYESLVNAFPLSSSSDAEIVDKIKAGEPFVIMGGSSGHAISIVIAQDQLVVFNRGAGRLGYAAEIFSLPSSMIDETMISNLKKIYDSIKSDPDSQNKEESFNNAIKKIIDEFKLKYLGGFQQQDQKVGNCCWASAKGAFGALCRVYGNEEVRKTVYKELTFLARKEALVAYLKEPVVNAEIIEQIKQKCLKKQGRWLELLELIQPKNG